MMKITDVSDDLAAYIFRIYPKKLDASSSSSHCVSPLTVSTRKKMQQVLSKRRYLLQFQICHTPRRVCNESKEVNILYSSV
jgi:hypothetical protein